MELVVPAILAMHELPGHEDVRTAMTYAHGSNRGAVPDGNNFATSKKRLLKAVGLCREIGFAITETREEGFVQDLRSQYEQAVREQFAREEQARIRTQIREEEKLAREIDKQIKNAEREQTVVEAALERAPAEAKDAHSAEVEHLRAKLKEAREKAEPSVPT